MQNEEAPMQTEEEAIEMLNARQEQKFLRQSGLPKTRWETAEPTRLLERKPDLSRYWNKITDHYENCENLVLTGGLRDVRVQLAAALAVHVRKTRNLYPRDAFFGQKHHEKSVHPVTGQMDWPYTFKYMDVVALEELYRERENAVRNDDDGIEETFAQAVVRPDFFFLIEVGHEFANSFTAKLIENLLYARSDADVPVVLTLERKASLIVDRSGNNVYEDIADALHTFAFKIGIGVV